MKTRDSNRLRSVVRVASALVAAGLAAWALADDSLIGGGPGFGFTQAIVLGIGLLVGASCLLPLAWNARVLAIVLSTGFSCGVAEIGLRTLLAGRYVGSNQYDARTLYRLVPGAQRESRREPINGGDRIVYRINSSGFRGKELRENPSLRVAVYGDSFVQGDFSLDENTFAVRLEHDLSERLGTDVEVVNAGVAGYGPDQVLRKMEGELAGLAPDLVIVCVFSGNDFGDLVRNKLYRIDEHGNLVENPVEVAEPLLREMAVRRNELVLKKVIRDAAHALMARLGLYAQPTSGVEGMTPRQRMDFFRDQHVREYDEYVVQGDPVVRDLAWDSYDADVSVTPDSDSARYKVALMDLIVGRIQQVAEAAHVPLVLVPIPHPLDVDQHLTAEVDPVKYPDYRRRHLVDVLEGIAKRRGIPVVDLFSPFQQRGSAEIYFHGFDDHWNDHGQDVAAEVVTEFLLSNDAIAGWSSAKASKMATAGS